LAIRRRRVADVQGRRSDRSDLVGLRHARDAVSRAVRFDAGKSWSDRFTFPVEFVAYESPRQYVTFKFHVPQASVDSVAAVKPGEWITATSRHRPASETEAIAAVRPYVQSAASSTTD
jgi:hypothetical protein